MTFKCSCKKCKKDFNSDIYVRKFCFDCRPKNKTLDKQKCHEISLLCKSRWEFQKKYPRSYKQSLKKGWLEEVCSHMPKVKEAYTKQDCHEKAKLCKSRSEFGRLYTSHYNSSLKNNWINEICDHMDGMYSTGFTRTCFVKNCNYKNRLGIFYILRCYGNDEKFYKLGITSSSIKERYSNGSDMRYKWDILLEIKGDPTKIWDLEMSYKRQIKNFTYTPKLWKCGYSTECFKCHGNSKILKKHNAEKLYSGGLNVESCPISEGD